jgi:hypothetical protein
MCLCLGSRARLSKRKVLVRSFGKYVINMCTSAETTVILTIAHVFEKLLYRNCSVLNRLETDLPVCYLMAETSHSHSLFLEPFRISPSCSAMR